MRARAGISDFSGGMEKLGKGTAVGESEEHAWGSLNEIFRVHRVAGTWENTGETRVSNEIPKVCSARGTSLAHVIREIKGKHFIVNVSREFNSPESF